MRCFMRFSKYKSYSFKNGFAPDIAYSWSRSRMGGWAVANSPMMRTTVTNERLEQRGYKPILKMFEKVHYV